MSGEQRSEGEKLHGAQDISECATQEKIRCQENEAQRAGRLVHNKVLV